MRSSINIKYDFNNSDILDNYLATSSHANIFKGVLNGFINSLSKAHIAYGPYGSGKSYISSLMMGMLTKSYSKADIDELKKKYQVFDPELANLIQQLFGSKIRYLSLVINGFEGDFDEVLISKLHDELRKNNLQKYMPSYGNSVKETLLVWKKEYPAVFNLFQSKLDAFKLSEDDFLVEIEKQSELHISWFEQVFKELSAGQSFRPKYSKNSLQVIEETALNLKKKGYGIFLIYDEFGRYLQNLKQSEVNGFMQKLQDLAEYANNGNHLFSCLFITHKQVSSYFTFLEMNQRGEFSKVEQRFKLYEIKSDYSTFVNIAKDYILDNNTNKIPLKVLSEVIDETLKYNFFSNYYNDKYVEEEIIKNMYPLHPLSTYMLPKISSVFGQNERTLFTFLTDMNQNGFTKYLKSSKGFYYPDLLVDYFIELIDDKSFDDDKYLKVFRSRILKLRLQISRDNHQIAERIYKLIFIWSLTFSSESFYLDESFLSYALGVKHKKIIEVIEEMKVSKFVRFNEIEKQLEIFNGSSLDIEFEIAKKRVEASRDKTNLFKVFNRLNPYKYIYSKEYNSRHDIIRFAKLFFQFENMTIEDFEFADMYVPLYFKSSVPNNDVYGIVPFDFYQVEEDVIRYVIIENMINDKFYILNYENLSGELEYELSVIKKKLNTFYKMVTSNTKYFIHGRIVENATIEDLSSYLSGYFTDIYTCHVDVPNDQINMFSISSIQQSAIEKIVIELISENTDYSLLEHGTQPLNLAYHSVINRNINNTLFTEIVNEVNNYVQDNSENKFSNIIEMLIKPPYGFRPYVSLLIVFYSLIDKWKDIVFYRNETYIPSISVSDLINNVISEIKSRTDVPSGIQCNKMPLSYYPLMYSYSSFDNENRIFLEFLEQEFKSFTSISERKSLSIKVCSSMYNWYIGLPVIVQQGLSLSLSEIQFLEIIRGSIANPIKAIDNLINMFGEPDEVIKMKISIDDNFNRFIQDFEKNTIRELGIQDVNTWTAKLSKSDIKVNKIANALKNNISLLDLYKDQVENIDIRKWTKSSFDMLKRTIIDEYKSIISDKTEYSRLQIDDRELLIRDVKLSQKGEVTLSNLVNLLDATGKYLTSSEIEKITLMLLERYVK